MQNGLRVLARPQECPDPLGSLESTGWLRPIVRVPRGKLSANLRRSKIAARSRINHQRVFPVPDGNMKRVAMSMRRQFAEAERRGVDPRLPAGAFDHGHAACLCEPTVIVRSPAFRRNQSKLRSA